MRVTHRDLKPANVLLGPGGPPVIDFGIARTEAMSSSTAGQIKGTVQWMAPELFRGRRPSAAVGVGRDRDEPLRPLVTAASSKDPLAGRRPRNCFSA
ncbi:protein kinase domain-containing protein [Nonomuraea sp. SYSU D8015]|uniref:protein kinase domain-containing protein n=1 Tax=Nonomuraea sp. SYSU D8015 TaxID=2593644 RepID=UPI001CB73613|nr:protein kinase [Nonomuraea sp. SYSU D8015]